MSPETTPTTTIEAPASKATALAELEQNAAQFDMSNEQYEATRASIEAAHSTAGPIDREEIAPEAHDLVSKYESFDESAQETSNVSAIFAEQQRIAARRAIDLAAGTGDGMDEDRRQAALSAIDNQYAKR